MTNIALLLTLATAPASAAPSPTTAATTEPPAASSSPKTRDVNIGPTISEEHVRDINRKWSGVGIGYHNGLWGQGFAQGIKLDIPFGRRVGQHFGMRLHGTLVHPPPGTGGIYDPVINTGLELFGRGPVWFGVLRAYGGGGAWVGIRPNPTGEGRDLQFTGGGHFGLEVIIAPRMSFTFEFGGQGPGHGLRNDDAGASVMAGFMVYLGDIKRRR